MSRALFRFVPELRVLPKRIATPSLSLASRAFNSTAPIVEPIPERHAKNAANPTVNEPRPMAFKKSHPAPPPKPVDDATFKDALTLLAAQPGHYITVHIHGFPYLVQEGDQIRLPFKMPGVMPGDILRLNRASVLGSRDYTVKGAPHIDEQHFECRATVIGTESEPMRIKIKKKRRQRRMRQAKSKHQYTILRISDLSINTPDIEMTV
ncbi:Putative Ribosomal protein YmL49, mitochondrial [[Torrubiella] hemipterigena]|uniref:Large ribosomal subunit protein bL21m n=1 Tax=[Torrubiella] hemipterigena TaxID=1531966 RepID=A0A0A1T0S6_9HYPO|nr:Putative Ribosomal protein YmL49, mitochondrial [[Torrubiella] hemipterigena]